MSNIFGNLLNAGNKGPGEDTYLYIFLHVPRCAGSSISMAIHDAYGYKGLHIPIKRKSIKTDGLKNKQKRWIDKEWIEDYISRMPSEIRNAACFLYGHTTYMGIHKFFEKQPRYFTFLRHPVSFAISHYNHLRKRRQQAIKIEDYAGIADSKGEMLEFEDLFKNTTYLKNLMTKILSQMYIGEVQPNLWWTYEASEQDLNNAKSILDNCWFVGLLENQSDFEWIAKSLRLNLSTKENISEKYFIPNEKQKELIMSGNQLDTQLYEYAKTISDRRNS